MVKATRSTRKKTVSRKRGAKKVAITTQKTTSMNATSVSQIVKSILNKNADTKFVAAPLSGFNYVTTLQTYNLFSGDITSPSEIYSLIPPVYQGLSNAGSSATRIGDEITPTKLTVKMTFGCPYQQQSADLNVHVFFLTCKSVKFAGNYSAVPITQLLNKGDGTNVGFTGDIYNAQLPVNNKEFTLLSHKVIRLTKPGGYNNTSQAPSSNVSEMVYPKDSFKTLTKSFKLPKLKYADDNDYYPSNSFPFVVVGYTTADTANFSGHNTNLYVQGMSTLSFKDF